MTVVVPPKGPFPSDLAIVGEAPGRDEALYGECFIGSAGSELMRMLIEADIHPAMPYFTNVFKVRPENNDVEKFFVPKKEGIQSLPPLRAGKYLPQSALHWLELLGTELALVRPKLILALGNTALWALCRKSGIQKFRGVIHDTPHGPVLPAFHPVAILRNWSLRSLTIGDFTKAKQFLDGTLAAPKEDYELLLNPTIAQFDDCRRMAAAAARLGIDIETSRGQITMVGFATSPTSGFCIPFWDPETCTSYWPTVEEELLAWQLVRDLLALPVPKVLHNGMYDLQYLAKITNQIPLCDEDTILLHHALQPEMKKDLGTLGATYLNRGAWKQLRHRKADEIVKKDE